MNYLLLGQDSVAKDAKLAELKRKNFPSLEALQFDYEVLYAQKLDSETLKKSLVALPALSKERLVVIKECHKLNPHNKELLFDFLENPGPCTLILDSEKNEEDEFLKKIGRIVKVINCQKEPPLNVFTLTRAIGAQKSVESLKILSQLLLQGDQPLQIMGGLVWFWKKSRADFSAQQFKKGLLFLQEADLNIKRSRLSAQYALELLVVKLCSQGAG